MEKRFLEVVGCNALGCIVRVDDKEMTFVFRKRGRVLTTLVYNDMSKVLAIERGSFASRGRVAQRVLFSRFLVSKSLVNRNSDFRTVGKVQIEKISVLNKWLAGVSLSGISKSRNPT